MLWVKKKFGLFAGLAFFLTIILVVVLILLRQKSAKMQIPNNTEEVTVTDESVENNKEDRLPSTFPSDFPIYPESVVAGSFETDSGMSVSWETGSAPTQVFNYLKDQLEKLGWVVEDVLESGSSNTLSFSKEERYGFLAVTKGEDEATVISATIGKGDQIGR